MKHLLIPLTAFLCGLPCFAADKPFASVKPNIVFILADDLGYANVGFTGPDIKTPNIDKLRAAGAKLDAFYTLPVCTPSRSALMTGRYPIRYGRQYNVLRPNSKVGLSLDERLLPEALREAGYATVHVGKWHLGEFDPAYWPMQRGFDHTYGYIPDQKHVVHNAPSGVLQRDEKQVADSGWLPELYTSEAVRRIEQRDPSKPLFLYLAYNSPHGPHDCPPEYSQRYASLGEARSVYAGMIAQMDDCIGRVVAAVEKAGIRDNTLFVFASDNGGLTTKGDIAHNTPYRAGKGSLYECGVRVVACAAWDGHIAPGSVVKEPLHMVDWFPTFVRLADGSLEQKHPLDGRDAWPAITQAKPSPHDVILLNTVGREGAVRAGDWKLVRNGSSADAEESQDKKTREEKRADRADAPDKVELFNLVRDPSETTDLSATEPEKVKELRARLDVFTQEAVPPILKPEQDVASSDTTTKTDAPKSKNRKKAKP